MGLTNETRTTFLAIFEARKDEILCLTRSGARCGCNSGWNVESDIQITHRNAIPVEFASNEFPEQEKSQAVRLEGTLGIWIVESQSEGEKDSRSPVDV
ncbi:hypothetical protein HHX47_DHR9000295 [Lentinula edodes]|nr:hypothetical protein HHX47_DHR9000295 [Lentinula edodes]